MNSKFQSLVLIGLSDELPDNKFTFICNNKARLGLLDEKMIDKPFKSFTGGLELGVQANLANIRTLKAPLVNLAPLS